MVFESNREGEFDVFIMESDGSNIQNLTKNFKGDCHTPQISLNSLKVVFISDESGNNEIYILTCPLVKIIIYRIMRQMNLFLNLHHMERKKYSHPLEILILTFIA